MVEALGALPPFAPALELAEKWAIELGKGTVRGQLTSQDGTPQPLLVVDHAGKVVFVRQERECLVVFTLVELQPDALEKVAKLGPDLQRRVFAAFRLQLMLDGRTGYALAPAGVKRMRDVRRVAVEQILKVDRDDPATFNRYADAIQEVVTTTVRAFSVFGHLLADDGKAGGTSGVGRPPPSLMYR